MSDATIPVPQTPKRIRGRPRSGEQKPVIDRLLEAAEELLKDHSHYDLTERKIAAKADTNEAMIHYYFDGKDGLLFALILSYYDEVAAGLNALDALDPASPTVTREIFEIMIDAYCTRHWMARIVVAELSRTRSTLKDFYMKKFGQQGLGLARLHRVLDRLVASGTYDRKVDVTLAASSMFSMIIGLFLMAPFAGGANFDRTRPETELWLNHVADLFDRQLRSGG